MTRARVVGGLALAFAAGTLGACASAPPVDAPAAATLPAEVAKAGEPGADVAALNSSLFRRAASAGAPGDLPLGEGDLIEISVVDLPELSGRRVRVPRQGNVSLPLLGEVPVSGRTAADVEADVRGRLENKYMHDPQVSVFVHERRSQRVSVLGAVKKGGVVELTGRLRLADALALAEGLTDDADQVVYLFRRAPRDMVARAAGAPNPGGAGSAGGAEIADVMTTIDLEAIANGSEELNVLLEAGDVIQVPRAGSVYVGGSVVKPGTVQLKGRTTLQQAVVAAGGPTNVAAWGDVRLYRRKPDGQVEVRTFDLDEFEAGKEVPVVQKNDVVVVGKSAIKAFFYGTVDILRGVFGVGVGL
jgi:polysaccharide export outer membrane protein